MSTKPKPSKSAPSELRSTVDADRALAKELEWLDDLDLFSAEEMAAQEAEELAEAAEPCHDAPEAATIANDEKS